MHVYVVSAAAIKILNEIIKYHYYIIFQSLNGVE